MEGVSLAIPVGRDHLDADIAVPAGSGGLVVFAHGSGSSRHSPRNRLVAREINRGGIGTALIDLLTPDEETIDQRTGQLRFNIPMLANRLISITDWISHQRRFSKLKLGYFGASTGAAAALIAAAARPGVVQAVVSRGGRPDLAGAELGSVTAPVLLIVGGDDHTVLDLNRQALSLMPRQTIARLEVIPGASHLFEEPGALEEIARLARGWFLDYLR